MELHNRKNVRLGEFDYSTNGAYFVTICTDHRKRILSTIRRGDPCGRPEQGLYDLGRIVEDTFHIIEEKYGVRFDTYVIMPDHIHFILFLPETSAESAQIALGRVVGALKSIVSHRYLEICKANGWTMGKIWQRNYYEHVVRNEYDLRELRAYIDGNPGRWLEKTACDEIYRLGATARVAPTFFVWTIQFNTNS